jgi:opacity protein-like surface antigen
LQAFTVTGGVFNRPFGFEVPYSSASLESPERARFNQTLFPGEEDLGASLTFQMPKASPWNFIKIEAGLFAGNGINPEFDKKKDFIGHIGIQKSIFSEMVKFGIGASYYNGGVYQGTANAYKMTESGGVNVFLKTPASDTIGTYHKREYKGFDAQLTFESPIGLTTLRGEYVLGTQPGQSKKTTSPTSDFTKVSGTATIPDTYVRDFNAGYFFLSQTIARTPLTLVVKYDFYDPNTKVKGNEIGNSVVGAVYKATTEADLRYSTLGMGVLFAVSSNVKITAYYDMVTNEKTSNLKPDFTKSNSNFSKDLKDNVFTLRLQYKF